MAGDTKNPDRAPAEDAEDGATSAAREPDRDDDDGNDADDERDDADDADDDAGDADASDDADDDASGDDADDGRAKKKAGDATAAAGDTKAPPRAVAARARRPRPKGSPTRNVVLFVALVGGIAAAFALLGSQTGGGIPAAAPKWKVGQTVPISITLVTTDYKNLACATKQEVNGLRCAFETQGRVNPKAGADARTNPKLLQPFTTASEPRMQFLAAGMWTGPDMKQKLDAENWDRPSGRFNVQCQYTVEGQAKAASVQWKAGEGWHPGNGWFMGTLSNCKIQP